jgi:paired amphipathic helix protein Sin3a
MSNNNWYLFFRLHQILCDRLTKIYNQAIVIANDEAKEKKERKESTAIALRLKPKSESEFDAISFLNSPSIFWYRINTTQFSS